MTASAPAATRIPTPDTAPAYLGPGSWSADVVAAHVASGVHPMRMRQVIATWPHPGDYEDAARRGGRAFAEAGWPAPRPTPMQCPPGGWIALDGTPDYPPHLTSTQRPPLLLFGLGDIAVLRDAGLGVVGAIKMTAYGQAVAQTAVKATPALFPVVAALADGVGACALEAALDAGIASIAVLATGPDQIHPTAHSPLAERIVEAGGALISEQPFGTGELTAPARTPAPLAGRQAARNRIVAGLSAVLVMAEGSGRCEAMNAVWSMLAMGRNVLVAPPKPHALQLPGAQAPLALAADTRRTEEQLTALGALPAAAQRWAGRAPLAAAVAADREDLALFVAVALHAAATTFNE